MKKKKTAYVGFRIEEDILAKFDAKAAETGLKRADLLRQHIRVYTDDQLYPLYIFKRLMKRLKRIEDFFKDWHKLKRQYRDVVKMIEEIEEPLNWDYEKGELRQS